MKVEHMPYHRGPHIPVEHCPLGTSTDDARDSDADIVATTLITSIITHGDTGAVSLCIYPVRFGKFQTNDLPPPIRSLYNNKFPALAYWATNFSWVVYGFNLGHFFSTISKQNLPFSVVLACDPLDYGRALFHDFSKCPTILSSAGALLNHIRASGDQSPLDGCLIHSHRYQTMSLPWHFGIFKQRL